MFAFSFSFNACRCLVSWRVRCIQIELAKQEKIEKEEEEIQNYFFPVEKMSIEQEKKIYYVNAFLFVFQIIYRLNLPHRSVKLIFH